MTTSLEDAFDLFSSWKKDCLKVSASLISSIESKAGKPNMGTEFWAEVYTKKSMERAAHILDLIDEKWPA